MRRAGCVSLLLFALVSPLRMPGTEAMAPLPARVEVRPTWTSIYIGTVSLQMPVFVRRGTENFDSTYTARVLPYFFSNETGRISIRVSDPDLERLARGEPIDFQGQAQNHAGEARGVEGKATPSGPREGKIKVKVRVSPSIELIFNTTYRLLPG